MWTIYKLWKTNKHTILKLWTLIKNIIENQSTHKFPYNILFTFLLDRGRAPNGIGHLMILYSFGTFVFIQAVVFLPMAAQWRCNNTQECSSEYTAAIQLLYIFFYWRVQKKEKQRNVLIVFSVFFLTVHELSFRTYITAQYRPERYLSIWVNKQQNWVWWLLTFVKFVEYFDPLISTCEERQKHRFRAIVMIVLPTAPFHFGCFDFFFDLGLPIQPGYPRFCSVLQLVVSTQMRYGFCIQIACRVSCGREGTVFHDISVCRMIYTILANWGCNTYEVRIGLAPAG